MIEIKELGSSKMFMVNGQCQGTYDKDGLPLSPYMKPIMHRIAALQASSQCLFLGGGAMLLPAYASNLEHLCEVWELSPEVIIESGKIHKDPKFTVRQEDARLVSGLEDEWFDFILLDTWPYTIDLYCLSYFGECKNKLKKNGLFVVNYCNESEDILKLMGDLLSKNYKVKQETLYHDKEMKKAAQAVYFCTK